MIKVGRGGEDDLFHFYHLFFLLPSLSPFSSSHLYHSLLLFVYNETLLAIMSRAAKFFRGFAPFFFMLTGLERINNSRQLSRNAIKFYRTPSFI